MLAKAVVEDSLIFDIDLKNNIYQYLAKYF